MRATTRHRFGNLQQRDGARSIIIGTIANGIEPRLVHLTQRIEQSMNARPLRRGRRPYWRVCAHRANNTIKGTNGIVIHRKVIVAHVIVVRAERHILPTQRRIASAQNGNHIACRIFHRRARDVEPSTQRYTRRPWLERSGVATQQYGGRAPRYPKRGNRVRRTRRVRHRSPLAQRCNRLRANGIEHHKRHRRRRTPTRPNIQSAPRRTRRQIQHHQLPRRLGARNPARAIGDGPAVNRLHTIE